LDRAPRDFSTVATIDVVVVFPWLPATAMPYLEAHQLGQQLAARITGDLQAPVLCTSGFCSSTAELTTSAFAPATLDARGLRKQRPELGQPIVTGVSFRSEPEMV